MQFILNRTLRCEISVPVGVGGCLNRQICCCELFSFVNFLICCLNYNQNPVNPRYPLRINVGFLIHSPIGTNREMHFDLPRLQIPPDLDAMEFSGVVRISRTPQGLLLQGEFQGSIGLECVRCLESYSQHLHATFDELYAFDERSITDSGLLVPEDAIIDLAPLVREYLMLEVPISPLCKPECRGLCVICGENLNLRQCEHVTGMVNQP